MAYKLQYLWDDRALSFEATVQQFDHIRVLLMNNVSIQMLMRHHNECYYVSVVIVVVVVHWSDFNKCKQDLITFLEHSL